MKCSITRILAIIGIISSLSLQAIAGTPTVDLGPDTLGCPGDTIMIFANISGGTPPYTVSWSPSANVVDPSSENTGIIVSGMDETYIISITDASPATFMDTIKVTSEWISIDAGADLFLDCGNVSGFYAPAITGSTPATFLWNTGSTGFFFSGLEPGVYCVTATNNFGCTSEDCFIIFQNDTEQDIAIGLPSQICAGSMATLTNNSLFIDTLMNGMGAIPITSWTWDPGDSSGTVTTFGDLNHTYANTGLYKVTLTMTIGGCEETFVQSIEVIDCNVGSSCTPDVTLTEPGLSPDQDLLPCIDRGVYYDEVIQFVNFDTLVLPAPFGQRVVDSIRLKRVDNLPCGVSWQTDRPDHVYAGSENGCIGLFGITYDSIGQYELQIIADAWLRSPSNGTVIKITDGMLSAFGLDYIVRVKNAQDTCWTLDTLFVNYSEMFACQGSDPSISIVLDDNQAVCDNGALQLSPEVFGGQGLLQYQWSPVTDLSCEYCDGPVTTTNSNTTYTLTVTDYNGITGSASVDVGVSGVSAELGPDTNLTCGQFFVNLSPQVSGDLMAPVTYLWNTGSTDSIVNLPEGSYSVTVTNGFGCTGSTDITVTVDSALSFNAGADSSICDSGTLTFALSPSILTDGSGNYVYTWSPAAGLDDSTIFMPTAIISSDQTYTLRIEDQNNGCSFTDSIKFDFSFLTVDAGADITINDGESDTLQPSIITDLGSGDYKYSWAPTLGLNDFTLMNPVASPSQSTTYILTVEDRENGCEFHDSVSVTVLTGIDERDISSSITVYPNPNSGEFLLNIQGDIRSASLRIYDVTGSLMIEKMDKVFSGQERIDVSNLSNGVYFIEVTTEDGVGRQRIVVQK